MDKKRLVCWSAALFVMFGMSIAQATVLDFNIDAGSIGLWNSTGDSYGDGVAAAGTASFTDNAGTTQTATYDVGAEGATPNLDMEWHYSSAYGTTTYGTGYGDLVDVAYIYEPWFLIITPDAGFAVKLHSFDFAHYGSVDDVSPIVQVYSSIDGTLYNAGATGNYTPAGGHGHVDLDLTASVDAELWVALYYNSGNGDDDTYWNYAVDNIVVSQVPEPASMLLLGLGSLLCARIKKNGSK